MSSWTSIQWRRVVVQRTNMRWFRLSSGTMIQRTRWRVRGKKNIMSLFPISWYNAIFSIWARKKGFCIILSLQAVAYHLQSRGGIKLDWKQPPDHFIVLATRMDGGVHVEADQLGQPSLDQHLPHYNRRRRLPQRKNRRTDTRTLFQSKPRPPLCQRSQWTSKPRHELPCANSWQMDQTPHVPGDGEREDQAQVHHWRRRDAQCGEFRARRLWEREGLRLWPMEPGLAWFHQESEHLCDKRIGRLQKSKFVLSYNKKPSVIFVSVVREFKCPW